MIITARIKTAGTAVNAWVRIWITGVNISVPFGSGGVGAPGVVGVKRF